MIKIKIKSMAAALFGLAAMLALPAAGQTNFPTVYFNLKTFASIGQGRFVTLTPQVNPVTDGTNIYWGASLKIYPTNGLAVITNLVPDNYTVVLDGAPGSWTLPVPWTNGYLNAAWLCTNLLTWSWNGVGNVYITNSYAFTNLPAGSVGTNELNAYVNGRLALVTAGGLTNIAPGSIGTNELNAYVNGQLALAGTGGTSGVPAGVVTNFQSSVNFANLAANNGYFYNSEWTKFMGFQYGNLQMGNPMSGYTPFSFDGITATYAGNGVGLTNVPASAIQSGKLDAARLPDELVGSGYGITALNGANIRAGSVYGPDAFDEATMLWLTELPGDNGYIRDAQHGATLSDAYMSGAFDGTFSGDGGGLGNLNGTNLLTGTVGWAAFDAWTQGHINSLGGTNGGGGFATNAIAMDGGLGTNITLTTPTLIGAVVSGSGGTVATTNLVNSATNALNTALAAKITGATNGLNGALTAAISGATNGLNTGLLAKQTAATNDLNTGLQAKVGQRQFGSTALTNWSAIAPSSKQDFSANLANWSGVSTGVLGSLTATLTNLPSNVVTQSGDATLGSLTLATLNYNPVTNSQSWVTPAGRSVWSNVLDGSFTWIDADGSGFSSNSNGTKFTTGGNTTNSGNVAAGHFYGNGSGLTGVSGGISLTDATNAAKGLVLAATNDLNTALVTRIQNATNDLNGVLALTVNKTNSGNIAAAHYYGTNEETHIEGTDVYIGSTNSGFQWHFSPANATVSGTNASIWVTEEEKLFDTRWLGYGRRLGGGCGIFGDQIALCNPSDLHNIIINPLGVTADGEGKAIVYGVDFLCPPLSAPSSEASWLSVTNAAENTIFHTAPLVMAKFPWTFTHPVLLRSNLNFGPTEIKRELGAPEYDKGGRTITGSLFADGDYEFVGVYNQSSRGGTDESVWCYQGPHYGMLVAINSAYVKGFDDLSDDLTMIVVLTNGLGAPVLVSPTLTADGTEFTLFSGSPEWVTVEPGVLSAPHRLSIGPASFRSSIICSNGVWIPTNATPGLNLPPVARTGMGGLWNSNNVLYWVTPDSVKLIAEP